MEESNDSDLGETKQHISRKIKIAIIITTAVILAGLAAVIAWWLSPRESGTSYPEATRTNSESNSEEAEEVKFTYRIFDPDLVKNIIPLGELNGGYIEAQTINGVTVNIKMDNKGDAPAIEVYAPVDMTLEDYSYFTGGRETPNWHLGFRISKDLKLSFDHITWVSDEVRAATPPTPTSGYVPPAKKLSFRAGEVIAKTSGTDQAHNWNIYLRDNRVTNTFANQERYEKLKERYDYINAACPFEYYEESEKQQFLDLMGFSKPGESKTCGTNSRDLKGTISGMWHLAKDGVKDDYRGQYATPFSIYKASSEQIIVYEINRQRFVLDNKNGTFKDPAAVTDSHCYALTEYGGSGPLKGYVYFKVISDMEMMMSYSSSGSCPASFPEAAAETYYR